MRNKIPQDISSQILTIGCEYKKSRGGIARVLSCYQAYVYESFRFVANSGDGTKIRKLLWVITALFRSAIALIRHEEVRIVHIHTSSYNSFRRSVWFVRLATLFNRKVVMHIHSGAFKTYYRDNEEFVRRILLRCDAIVALSDEWKNFFENEVGHPSVFVINNVVSEPFKLDDADERKDEKLHLLFLGLINNDKGIFDLLQSFAQLGDSVKNNLVLHVCGAGETERLKNMIQSLHLEHSVAFEGWVSGMEKVRLLNCCDVFVLPSYYEGLPISILEAMSYGMAIVSTRVGGIPSVVTTDENGYLLEPGETKALAKTIETLVENRDLVQWLGASSLSRISAYFPDAVSSQLRNMYNNLLNEKMA